MIKIFNSIKLLKINNYAYVYWFFSDVFTSFYPVENSVDKI